MDRRHAHAYAPVSTIPSVGVNQAPPPMPGAPYPSTLPPRPFAQPNYHYPSPPVTPYAQSNYQPPMPSPLQYTYADPRSPLLTPGGFPGLSAPSTPSIKQTAVVQESFVVDNYGQQPKYKFADYPIILLLFTVWGFLTLSCVVLLFTTYMESESTLDGYSYIDYHGIARAIALSTIPILCGTILNEVLLERCWRKVECFALGGNPGGRSVPEYPWPKMAKHLRSANFGWYKFFKRLFLLELSFRDWRTLASWICLRWGTAISIASTQLCVSWIKSSSSADDGTAPLYYPEKRIYWLVIPPFLHSLAIFGTLMMWFKWPWSLFSDHYTDRGLWESYQPYLGRVQAGSVATCDDVAKYMEFPDERGRKSLEKTNKPSLQLRKKLRGIWFGLLLMNVPAGLAWAYTWHVEADRSTVLRTGLYRFVFHFVFLAQNIFYVVALDFIVWNLSLEGLCKSSTKKPGRPKTRRSLRHLGQSAGLLLFLKAVRQRKPWRAAIFTWLFWLQACAMRFLTVTYILCVQVISYQSINDRKDIYDPNFWIGWIILTSLVTFPLILVWFFCPFQAPICEQDGWRWANIVQAFYSSGHGQRGYYGVVTEVGPNGEESSRATWGMDVQSFQSAKGKKLK